MAIPDDRVRGRSQVYSIQKTYCAGFTRDKLSTGVRRIRQAKGDDIVKQAKSIEQFHVRIAADRAE